MGVSTRKPGNSEPKEVNTSSFTQSPAGMQPTSLEQVQTLLTNKQKMTLLVMMLVVIREGGSVLQLEEEEGEDQFDVDVAVTNPEKVGQSNF